MRNYKIYTLSAVIVGYILTNNLDSYEQNALGNWFMTVGQILESNAAFLQVSLYNDSDNIKESNIGNNLSTKDKDDIKDFLNQIQNTLEQIKKEL